MQQIRDFLDSVGLVVLLSLFGGVALAAKNRERSLWGLLCCCVVAVFTGLVTAFLMDELARLMPVSDNLKNICVSLAAFSGGSILERWIDRLADIAGAVFGQRPRQD